MRDLSLQEWIAVAAALVVIVGLIFVLNRPELPGAPATRDAASSVLGGIPELVQEENGELIVRDLAVGDGDETVPGSEVVVHYVGILPDGTPFDNSVERGEPFVFRLGAGNVIRGWDEGLVGMREGGRRVLVVPPELGYGAAGTATIPPNSTLIFEVLLLDVR